MELSALERSLVEYRPVITLHGQRSTSKSVSGIRQLLDAVLRPFKPFFFQQLFVQMFPCEFSLDQLVLPKWSQVY